MSDSSIALKPVIDEPSKPIPSSRAPPSSSRGIESRMFIGVLNLTSTGPLDEIAAFYGETQWWVSDSHNLGAELEERGFVRDYGWMKFSRGVSPREAHSDLHVELAGSDRADDFGRLVRGGVGMETGEVEEGRLSSSYRNILRAGFREAYVRPNYRARR